MAGIFNTHTAIHAHRYIFVHPDDLHLVPNNVVHLSARGGRITGEQLPPHLLSDA